MSPLSVDQQLADALAPSYIVVRELGAGGMAKVYLARDERHGREVAIKVLHPELAAVLGAERFLSEIRTTASLQHPHILPLFDSGSAAGQLFYVMPFIDGETLRTRLEREQQLPIADAVRIAREVADALQYAHERGVIHRDIKPENILLQGGHALVADFGIALAVQSAGGTRMTQTGLSLGTPHYMAPEQAMGEKSVDRRADVWALGAVTYEMLTGEPPYDGPTAQAVVAKMLSSDPAPMTRVRTTIPAHIDAAVLAALARLPADRFSSARAFAEALTGNANSLAIAGATQAATSPARGAPAGSRRLVTALALVAAGTTASTIWLATRPVPAAGARAMRVDLALPDSVRLFDGPGRKIAISHDGTMVVFSAQRGATMALYLRRLHEATAAVIAGTERDFDASGFKPAFAPDDRSIVFADVRGVWSIPVAGGTARRMPLDEAGNEIGDPVPGDSVLYVRGDSLLVGNMATGGARLLGRSGRDVGKPAFRFPAPLPGRRETLVTLWRAGEGLSDGHELALLDPQGGGVRQLGVRGFDAHYVSTGHLVFARPNGEVHMVPFSLAAAEVTGEPRRLVEGVWQGSGGATDFAVADDGMLVHVLGEADNGAGIGWLVDPSGATRPLPGAERTGAFPRVSPDGRYVAWGATTALDDGIWVQDRQTGAVDLSPADSTAYRPEWSADGRRLYFLRRGTRGTEIVARQWPTGGADTVLAVHATLAEFSPGPAGGHAVLRMARALWTAPMDALQQARRMDEASGGFVNSATVSPDGRLVAYASTRSGTREVYVAPLPGPGRPQRVSVDGGTDPRWELDGRTLRFRAGGRVMLRARVEEGGALVRVDTLFVLPPFLQGGGLVRRNWDLLPGSTSYLVVRPRARVTRRLALLVGWTRLPAAAP